MLILKRKFFIIIICIFVFNLFGCSRNSSTTEQDLKIVTDAVERLKSVDNGEINLISETIPSKGNIESLNSSLLEKVHLSFNKDNNVAFYNYKYEDNNDTTINVKRDKNGLFQLNDNEKWEILDTPIDYYSSILKMTDFKFGISDINNIKFTQKNKNKMYTVTISKESLIENIQKLSYTFWLNTDDELIKLEINQVGTMTVEDKTDSITTNSLFEFIY